MLPPPGSWTTAERTRPNMPAWRADGLAARERRNQAQQRPHGADAAAAVDAVLRMTLQATPGARSEITLDVMRQVLLRPLVIGGSAEQAHDLSRGACKYPRYRAALSGLWCRRPWRRTQARRLGRMS